jgi:hypothetical protein
MGIDNGKVHVMTREQFNEHLEMHYAFLKEEYRKLVKTRSKPETPFDDDLLEKIIESMDTVNDQLGGNITDGTE